MSPPPGPETPALQSRPSAAQNDLVCREGSRAQGQGHASDGPQALGWAGVLPVHTWAETVLEMSRRENGFGLSCTDPGEDSGTGAPPGTHPNLSFGVAGPCVGPQVTFWGAQSTEQGSPRLGTPATSGPDPVCPEARSSSRALKPQPSDAWTLHAHSLQIGSGCGEGPSLPPVRAGAGPLAPGLLSPCAAALTLPAPHPQIPARTGQGAGCRAGPGGEPPSEARCPGSRA